MKNDVVRWSAGCPKENSKFRTREKKFLDGVSDESSNQNLISTSLVTIVTTPNLSSPKGSAAQVQASASASASVPAPAPSLTRSLRSTKITKANLLIDCDNTFLVKPIETCNLLSKHSKSVSDYVGTNKYNKQFMSVQRCNNNRDKRFLNLSFKHVVACSLHLTILILLCNFNLGVTAVGYIETNTDNLLSNEIPYELVYENNEPSGTSADGHYTHTWAVHIPNGDAGVAEEVAKDHGFVNLGKIFDDHYHFAHHKVSKRSLQPAEEHQTRLDEDHRVHWAKQQKAKSRQKRDFIYLRPSRTSSRSLSLADTMEFDDPKWFEMWYLNRGNGLDMNVIPAWKEGITGKGIVVTILDDGLESDHPDLEHNYDKNASYDVNGHDEDPMPHYDLTDSNRHGTRCAGEVAATANNSICAVGIAFGARVGGVRMLDGDVTDAVEARSLSLHPQHIDIYSASWGPDDDGKTVDGPGELASRAFLEGVTKGRGGKGSIFIWASGNGGRELDNCNCDGYTNSIWTLSISSATEEGHVPWYSEKCSSTLATTYSSGGQNEKQVVTTDLHHSCTKSHTGTSASAPLAAGIAALVLESNTNLTWRDLQHIVVRTAKPANLKDSTWSVNGVGRRISHSFGYGLMDAAAMVKLARKWKTVPEQQRCEINAPHVDKSIQPRGYITLQLTVKHCSAVNYLEHVQAKITLTSQRRGDIQLYLKSPAGTKVTLLTQRVHDASRSGFNQWPFMSVHTWGESPHGNWQLEIHNEGRYLAQITQWDLIFYGTEAPAQPDDPVHFGPGQLSPLGNDMVTNDIEDFDNSRQWHNMKQVGDNNLSHDKTNISCLTTTTDNRCLACAPPTFLYKSRCYDECPVHTFGRTPQTAHSDNNILSDNHLDSDRNFDKNFEELQSMDRKKRQNEFIDLPVTTAGPLEIVTNTCGECDTSCFNCYGPLNSQCSTCYPGSQLRKLLRTNETFCYVFTERSTGNELKNSQMAGKKSGSTGVKVALIAAPIFIICAILAFFRLTGSKWEIPFATSSQQVNEFNVGCLTRYNYDRVALISDEEDGDDDDDEEYDLFAQNTMTSPETSNMVISPKSEEKNDGDGRAIEKSELEVDTDTKINCEDSSANAIEYAEETVKLLNDSS